MEANKELLKGYVTNLLFNAEKHWKEKNGSLLQHVCLNNNSKWTLQHLGIVLGKVYYSFICFIEVINNPSWTCLGSL